MDWSKNLDKDLVEEIASRLDSHADYTRFRATCKTWRSLLPRFTKNLLPCQLPCLMLAYSGQSDFFSLSVGDHGEVYKLAVPLDENMVCIGSSKGWLVILGDGPSMHLVNPLKPDTILELPPMHTLPDVIEYHPERMGTEYVIRDSTNYVNGRCVNRAVSLGLGFMKHKFIGKVVLSCCPTQTNCLVLAIYGMDFKLACCRLGDDRWTSVDQGQLSDVEDIVHYDGKFYIGDIGGYVFVLSDDEIMENRSRPQTQLVQAEGSAWISVGRLYLVVESPDGLLLVNRRVHWWPNANNFTHHVNIFKLDLNTLSLCEVESLGENVLFLGVNESFSVSSGCLPGSLCKGNYIYFADGFADEPVTTRRLDVGVFDLNNRNMLPLALPTPGDDGCRTRIWPKPVWIRPSTN